MKLSASACLLMAPKIVMRWQRPLRATVTGASRRIQLLLWQSQMLKLHQQEKEKGEATTTPERTEMEVEVEMEWWKEGRQQSLLLAGTYEDSSMYLHKNTEER